MKTLMRNGRDRRSENPFLGHARKERVSLFGTDQRITSGPAATRLHSKAEYMTAPERFADSQIPLAPRAPSIHDPRPTIRRHGFIGAGNLVSTGLPPRSAISAGGNRTLTASHTSRHAIAKCHLGIGGDSGQLDPPAPSSANSPRAGSCQRPPPCA